MCAAAKPFACDATRSAGTPEAGGQCVGEPGHRGGGDEQLDLAEVERLGFGQFTDGRLGALKRLGGVGLGDLDGEDVPAMMDEPAPGIFVPVHPALEQLRELGERRELECGEARARVLCAQQDRAPERGKVEPFRDAGLRVRVARDDHPELDRSRREHPVNDVDAGQEATRPVGHVKRERSVTRAGRAIRIRADVLLDQGRKRRLVHQLVVVHARVDEQIQLLGRPLRTLQAQAGGSVRELQRAGAKRPW